jgi:PAS domain S-box-containing protein
MECLQQRIVVADDATHGDAEIRHLRSSINDLISLQTLPAIWDGRESGSIVSTLLDVLASMLRLDIAFLRLSNSMNGSPVEFLQLAQRRAPPPQVLEIGRALDQFLTNESASTPLVVPNPAGDGEVKIAPLRLGLTDEMGVLVVGSKRADFPTPTEALLLRVAANQALVALQEARQLHEQKRAAEELEHRVADRTTQFTAANVALRESEKKYRTLFDSIDEGFCTVEVLFDENDHPIDYRFLEVNPSFEKQSGIQNAQGRRMREIAPHHEKNWFEIYGRIALTGEPMRFENQAAQLHRWYDVYAFRVGEPGQRKVAILFKDITERKQAEAKLLRNEAFLSEAQRLSHTGSCGWRPSTGELLWSEETFRIFQYEPTMKPTVELVLNRVHPDDRDRVKRTIQRVSQDGTDIDIEHRLLLPDGSIKHVRVVAHAEKDRPGAFEFVGAIMDVTVAKEAEASLQRIEFYLSEGQRMSHTGSWAWSVKTKKNLFWSQEQYRIYGFDPASESGQFAAARARIHPEDDPIFDSVLERAIHGRTDFEIRHRVVLPAGVVRHLHTLGHPLVNEAGELEEYIGTTLDVTEQYQARAALVEAFSKIEKSEASLRTIIDTIPTLVWSSEADGSVEFVNRRWSNYTGLTTNEARGSGWRAAIHPEDIGWLSDQQRSAMASGRPFELEARMRRYDGQYRWFIHRAEPLMDDRGKILKWYGTNTDIDDRKRAEEALRRSEAYLTESQRLTHTGSWAWNPKTRENVYWSKEHFRICGFDPETYNGEFGPARDRIHPDDVLNFDEAVEQAIRERRDFEEHHRIILPGGAVRYIHGIGHPVFNDTGEVVEYVGTVMDVTERKRAEEALRRSESYLAEAQRLSHTGSWARSLVTGEISYWSDECRRVLGFEPHEVLPKYKTFLQHVHPDDQDKLRKTAETSTRDKVEYEVDYRIIHPGGQVRDIHAVGHPIFSPSGDLIEYVGTVIDVTERKRAQVLLSGENRLLEMIARGVPRARILEAICRLVEELVGGASSSILLLDPKTNQLWHGANISLPAAYVEAINGLIIGPHAGACGTAAYMAEPVIVSDIATDPLWVDYRALALAHGLRACWSSPILSSAGRVLGTFAIYNRERRSPTESDQGVIGRIVHLASIVIERELAEEAFRQSQADLAHVSRLTTMGELTASIAHEVNQPLTAVVNNANFCLGLLPKNTKAIKEVREALSDIINDAERASTVITRVRQLARKAPIEWSRLDLKDVITDVLALARHESATRRVTIRVDLSKDLPSVAGDRVQLQQVLLNLVMNGMDAMSQVRDTNRLLIICGQREKQGGAIRALVSVQDSGTGFKPDEMDRLFEAFYSTKPQGMGMGLAISRSIIQAHGGRLWAEANQGPGATFLFSLPAADPTAS